MLNLLCASGGCWPPTIHKYFLWCFLQLFHCYWWVSVAIMRSFVTQIPPQMRLKWQEYISWQGKINEAKASAAALKASINGMSTEGKPPESKWRAFFRKSPLEDVQVVKNNIYDKGFFHNLHEIIFPPSMRSSFLQSKSKSG